MSRADNGVEDVDDEFTQQAKDAANAAAASEDAADEPSTTEASATSDAKESEQSKDKAATAKKAKDSKKTKVAVDEADGEADDKPTKRSRREPKPAKIASGLNPSWWVPTMLGLMVLGLIWLVVFYLSGSRFPIPNIGTWNLAIGFVLLMAGFAMTTRWK